MYFKCSCGHRCKSCFNPTAIHPVKFTLTRIIFYRIISNFSIDRGCRCCSSNKHPPSSGHGINNRCGITFNCIISYYKIKVAITYKTTNSCTIWCRPVPSSVSPMYIPGRFLTASKPRNTVILPESYLLSSDILSFALLGYG